MSLPTTGLEVVNANTNNNNINNNDNNLLLCDSAFSVLGVAHWGCTVEALAVADPVYEQLASDQQLAHRVTTEALYHEVRPTVRR